jgi:hypothetical protein
MLCHRRRRGYVKIRPLMLLCNKSSSWSRPCIPCCSAVVNKGGAGGQYLAVLFPTSLQLRLVRKLSVPRMILQLNVLSKASACRTLVFYMTAYLCGCLIVCSHMLAILSFDLVSASLGLSILFSQTCPAISNFIFPYLTRWETVYKLLVPN